MATELVVKVTLEDGVVYTRRADILDALNSLEAIGDVTEAVATVPAVSIDFLSEITEDPPEGT